MSAAVSDAVSVDLALVLQARELWPRVRGQFTDPRLRDSKEDLESSAVERVLKDKDAIARLHGAEREAALIRALQVGALDEARKTTGSKDRRVRTRIEELGVDELNDAGDDEQLAQDDATMAAAEVLDSLNLTGDEQLIAGCYAVGCRTPRDIAFAIGETVPYVNERLRTLLPYMRGMLADYVAPSLDERTRELICRYAQGELDARRYWRERHNAERLVANNSHCTALYEAQRATDKRLAIFLPLPLLAALSAAQPAGAVSEHGAHAAGALRQHLADAAASARRHAASAYQKIDPTPLAGMRPGPAASVIASCLTLGAGAGAYCLNASVNPLEAITSRTPPAHHKRSAAHTQPRASRLLATASVPTPPIPASPAPTPAPRRAPAPVRQMSTTPSSPPPAPADEFGPESSSASTSSARQASPPPRRPAPAPANGPGEFAP